MNLKRREIKSSLEEINAYILEQTSKMIANETNSLSKTIDNLCFEYMKIHELTYNDLKTNMQVIKYIDKPYTEHYFYKDNNIFDINYTFGNDGLKWNIVKFFKR
jgi:hypothetical protein